MSSDQQYYGNVRVRVNGLLLHQNALLLVKMQSPVSGEDIWIPPGGGVKFGESLSQTLIREMREECGLQVKPGPLRYIHEVISGDVHAVEFYYDVTADHPDTAKLGSDPEYHSDDQLLKDLRFISLGELDRYPVVPEYLQINYPKEARITSPVVLQITPSY